MKKIIAQLESKIDHLETEISYINSLLIEAGFPDGIATIKEVLEHMKLEQS